MGGVEQCRRVAHRAADTVLHAESTLVALGPERDATLAGLEAHEPATRRRDADGTATVAGVGERHHAGGDGCSRAAAGATGRASGVPRVVGGAPRRRFCGGHAAELRAVRAPGDHQPGRFVAADERGVHGSHVADLLQGDVAVTDALTGVRCVQILDEERHTPERTSRNIARRDLASVVEPADGDGVEHRIDTLDAFDRSLQQLARRGVTAGHQGGLVGCIHPAGVIGKRAHTVCVAGIANRLWTGRR